MSKPIVAPEAVSMLEAGKIMSVSERSVRTLCKLGLLPSFKIGRTVRIRYAAILHFMESGGAELPKLPKLFSMPKN